MAERRDLIGGNAQASRAVTLTFVARLLFLLAPWLFIAYLFRDVDAALTAVRNASVAPMVGGLLLTLAALVGTALLWVRLVAHLNRDLAVPESPYLLRAFARSWLARYLPGKVWSYGARVIHTDANVTPRRIVASSLVNEFALIVGSATALGLGLWTWALAGPVVGLPVLLVGLMAVVAVVSRVDQVTQLALKFLGRRMPQPWRNAAEEMQQAADDPGLGLRAAGLFTGGYVLTNFLFGVAFALIVLSVGDVAVEDFPLLVGGYNLAAVAGIVAFFAPAGLGVREGVVAAFLTPVVGGPVAASLAILVRLVVVLTDVIFVALMEVASLFFRRGPAPFRAANDDPRTIDTPATRSRQ